MPPLRIVLVMIEPPLPFGNAAARWFYVLLRGLVERGHRVTAFAVCGKPNEIDEARRLFPTPDYDLRLYSYPTNPGGLRSKWRTLMRPFSYLFTSEMRRDLEAELARGFDVLHLEQLWCGWLSLPYVDRCFMNVLNLYAIDLSECRPTSLRGRLIQRLALTNERRLLRRFPRLSTCSPRLERAIREIHLRADVVSFPLGLETVLYPFIADDRRNGEAVVSVIGSMNWLPTQGAAVRLLTRLWPEIKRRVPGARVQIVGWSARSALAEYLDLPDVEIVENVPEIQPYFDRTSVLLYAPSRGSGMKIKILEAMAFGVPVVTTSEGVEGIPALDGVHAGVCEDDAGLIDRTVALLQNPSLQNQQRRAARALLEAHCGPDVTLDAVESIYQKIVKLK
jgi:glycosyltransferase involved in cell wall biosynthesis